MWVRLRWFAVAVLVLSGCAPVLSGCAPAPTTPVHSTGPPQPVPAVEQSEGPPAAPELADAFELRADLEMLLGHHATLIARFLRSRIAGEPDFLESAVAALSHNTDDLSAVVERVYDTEAAEAFRDLWVDHNQALFAYAAGVADGDDEAQQEAEAALDAYRQDFGAFTEEATAGELQADVVADALGTHIDHLLDLTDAYADGDYSTAYRLQREAYAHMFPTGTSLAGGFGQQLPGEFPVAFDEPPAQLRSALGLLLGEHVELGIDAMRAGVTGAPDFTAAAGALEENTDDLTAAFEALVGAEAAGRFRQLWADHVDHLVAYTVAVAEDDDEAREAASQGLSDYEQAFGEFLEAVTAEEMDAGAVREAMRVHDEQLTRQIEAYAAGDYPEAHEVAFDTYQHVFDTAAALAAAIQSRMGVEMPLGGAATGAGGTAADADGR